MALFVSLLKSTWKMAKPKANFIAEECKEKEDHIHRLGDYCSKTARKLKQTQERQIPMNVPLPM